MGPDAVRAANVTADLGIPVGAARAVRLCDGAELVEGGPACVFDVLHRGEAARAFALRHRGRVVAYLNRCLHQPREMDWVEGRFLDAAGTVIVCALHGAEYAPADGRCLAGPCGDGRLTALAVGERAGGVYWYPSHDTLPAPGDTPAGDG